ncbi:MAG: glutamate--cysteine ligase, partial [Burkholderiaceae bacterium]|nr:glutamate--cysteine ligase [Burkholderiaceae bacterium]
PLAAALDATHHSSDYGDALRAAQALVSAPQDTPSARVLARMAAVHGNNFTAFSTSQSAMAREALLALPWGAEQQARFDTLARESLAQQKAIEAADTLPFEEWRQQYMAVGELG